MFGSLDNVTVAVSLGNNGRTINMPVASGSEISKENNGREKEEAIKNVVYKCPVNKALQGSYRRV